jgi:hypothetical protein
MKGRGVLAELEEMSKRHGGDPVTGDRSWTRPFAQKMADNLPDLLLVAKYVAGVDPGIEFRGPRVEKTVAECWCCEACAHGDSPYYGQPETSDGSAESLAAWNEYRLRYQKRADALLAEIEHAPDCAWVAVQRLITKVSP